MKGKFINLMLAAALMTSASASFVSCKDTESDDYQELEYKLNNLDSKYAKDLQDIDAQIAAINSQLSSITSCTCNETQVRSLIDALTTRVDQLASTSSSQATQIADIINRLNKLETNEDNLSWQQEIEALKTQLSALQSSTATQQQVTNLTNLYQELVEKVNKGATADEVKALTDRILALEAQSDDTSWKAQIDEINKKLADLQASSGSGVSSAAIQQLQNDVAALKTRTDDTSWKEQIAALQQSIKDLQATDTDVKKSVSDLKTTMENMRNELVAKINAYDALITKAQNTADAASKDAKDALAAANALQAYVDANCSCMKSELGKLKSLAADMVTSLITEVIVQATDCPAVGELAVPLDIQSNMLVTYYGTNTNEVAFQFPTNVASLFYTKDQAVAKKLAAYTLPGSTVTIPEGTILAEGDTEGSYKGNAGTLWVTVNPNTVDVSGVNFTLQDSQGKPYGILESAEADNNTVLKWGWTRANANGQNFYKIPATITLDELNKYKITINTSKVRASVQKLIDERDQTKIALKEIAKNVAKFIYDNMTLDKPRLAVATQYSVAMDTATRTMTNVSDMNILAGAVQPVGVGELDNVKDMETIPGLETAEERVSRFIHDITIDPITLNVNATEITELENIDTLKRNGKNFDVTITYKYIDKNGDEATGTTTVPLNDNVDNLLKIINDTLTTSCINAVDRFNASIRSLNLLIEDVQKGFNVNGSLKTTKDQMTQKVNNALNRVNDRLAYWFNRSKNAFLRPAMLFETTDGAYRLRGGGTNISGTSIKLIPTTYTYELLAPAYKKYVTVLGHPEMTGTNLNKVINGDVREVTIEGLESGQSYDILYELVDYKGKVAAKIFTINVK